MGLFSGMQQGGGGLDWERILRQQMNPYANTGPSPGMQSPFAVNGQPMPSPQLGGQAPTLDKPPMGEGGDDSTRRRHRGIRGFIEGIGDRWQQMSPQERAMTIQSFAAGMSGDRAGAQRIAENMAELRQRREAARIEAERRQSLMNNFMKEEQQGGLGMSPGATERAMVDPENFMTEYNTRFRTREASPGVGIVTPNMAGGPPQVFNQPTTPMQHAAAAGLTPGTPEYFQFIQDAELQGQGPTAERMQGQRLDVTRRGQDIGAGTARRGQDMSDARGRRGQDMSAETTRQGQAGTTARTTRGQNLRGLTPTGRTATGQGGRRVMEVRGARGQVGWVDMQTGEPVG